MKQYKDFQEFYNKSIELTKFALSKCTNKKEAILYARKNFNKSDLKSYYKIGTLTKEQIKILSAKENIIKLSIDSMIKNILEHPDLDIEDYLKLRKFCIILTYLYKIERIILEYLKILITNIMN